MQLVSSAQMQAIDLNCEYHGLSRLQLMENAGKAIADLIRSRFKPGIKIQVLAGTGNNGGDGCVVARHLAGEYQLELILLGSPDQMPSIARRNFELAAKCVKVIQAKDPDQIPDLDAGLILDALLGTGVKGKLREPIRSAILKINSAPGFKLCVDLPSGMDPDTGSYELRVEPDLVACLHKLKPGLSKLPPAKLVVLDIGIPPQLERLCGPGDLSLIPARDPNSHKGQNGRILIIGGGPYSGAPALAGLACLRTGADLVVIACPRSVSQIVSGFSPNLIVRPLDSEFIQPKHVPYLLELSKDFDVVCIGPGAGRDDQVLEALAQLISKLPRAVIDADGLHAFAQIQSSVRNPNLIITPHRGEFRMLSGQPISADLEQALEQVKQYAKSIGGATCLLKAPKDIISDGNRIKLNLTGNPGMSVGGTGDVLSGIVSQLFALSKDPFLAAAAGAFICGLAGDLAFRSYGNSLLATDVIQAIPQALKESGAKF